MYAIFLSFFGTVYVYHSLISIIDAFSSLPSIMLELARGVKKSKFNFRSYRACWKEGCLH